MVCLFIMARDEELPNNYCRLHSIAQKPEGRNALSSAIQTLRTLVA